MLNSYQPQSIEAKIYQTWEHAHYFAPNSESNPAHVSKNNNIKNNIKNNI